MAKIFETERLLFQPVKSESHHELRRFYQDQEVMRFIGTGQILEDSQIEAVLGRYLDQEKNHPALGAWLLYFKKTQELAGSAILRTPMTNDPIPGLEIGYMFFKDFWGQGLASEAAHGLVDYGMREAACSEFVAMVRPGNLGSAKVLLKAQFLSAGKLPYIDPKTQAPVDLDFYKRIVGGN